MSAGLAANGVRHEEKVEYEVPDNSTPHPGLLAIQVPSKAKQNGENEDTSIHSSSSKSASASGGDSHATATTTTTKTLPSAFDKASKGQEEAIRRQSLDYQKSTSLPPEILGLYKREDKRHSRNLSQQPSERGTGGASTPSDTAQDNIVVERAWNLATVDSCPILVVAKGWTPKEGVNLSPDLIIGKHMSSGLQGGVYDLLNPDGTKAKVVFKWVHQHALLAEVEREWEVGMRLNQLAYKDGSLPGFMGVGAGIRCRGKFRGMLLERVQGTTVDKVICTRNFHDVRYVYDMLYSVFTALDRAQGALGFHHSDLRLANVMEIERRKKGKTQDSLNDRTRDSRPPTPVNNNSVDVLDSPPDDNSARHLFKIIDYGLANFEETFAAGPDVVLENDVQSQASRRSINIQRQNSISPATGCVAAFPFPMIQKDRLGKLPSPSPIERLYRFMWRRKGDVYHLVFELGEWLDGRVWAEEDRLDVLRLVDLIHHVTGVRIKCWFSDDITGEDSVAGWRDRACGPFERHDSAMHFLRRWNIRLRSWLNPSNPGLTAAEALTAPFFTKRISLRGVIHGCSTRYAKWTRAPSQRKAKATVTTGSNAV